jgi:hypothetical protein
VTARHSEGARWQFWQRPPRQVEQSMQPLADRHAGTPNETYFPALVSGGTGGNRGIQHTITVLHTTGDQALLERQPHEGEERHAVEQHDHGRALGPRQAARKERMLNGRPRLPRLPEWTAYHGCVWGEAGRRGGGADL